jgi:hypothetical protein
VLSSVSLESIVLRSLHFVCLALCFAIM